MRRRRRPFPTLGARMLHFGQRIARAYESENAGRSGGAPWRQQAHEPLIWREYDAAAYDENADYDADYLTDEHYTADTPRRREAPRQTNAPRRGEINLARQPDPQTRTPRQPDQQSRQPIDTPPPPKPPLHSSGQRPVKAPRNRRDHAQWQNDQLHNIMRFHKEQEAQRDEIRRQKREQIQRQMGDGDTNGETPTGHRRRRRGQLGVDYVNTSSLVNEEERKALQRAQEEREAIQRRQEQADIDTTAHDDHDETTVGTPPALSGDDNWHTDTLGTPTVASAADETIPPDTADDDWHTDEFDSDLATADDVIEAEFVEAFDSFPDDPAGWMPPTERPQTADTGAPTVQRTPADTDTPQNDDSYKISDYSDYDGDDDDGTPAPPNLPDTPPDTPPAPSSGSDSPVQRRPDTSKPRRGDPSPPDNRVSNNTPQATSPFEPLGMSEDFGDDLNTEFDYMESLDKAAHDDWDLPAAPPDKAPLMREWDNIGDDMPPDNAPDDTSHADDAWSDDTPDNAPLMRDTFDDYAPHADQGTDNDTWRDHDTPPDNAPLMRDTFDHHAPYADQGTNDDTAWRDHDTPPPDNAPLMRDTFNHHAPYADQGTDDDTAWRDHDTPPPPDNAPLMRDTFDHYAPYADQGTDNDTWRDHDTPPPPDNAPLMRHFDHDTNATPLTGAELDEIYDTVYEQPSPFAETEPPPADSSYTPDMPADGEPLNMEGMQIPRINNPRIFNTLSRRLRESSPADEPVMRSHDADTHPDAPDSANHEAEPPHLFDALRELGGVDVYEMGEPEVWDDEPVMRTPDSDAHTGDTAPSNNATRHPTLFDALRELGTVDLYQTNEAARDDEPVMRSHDADTHTPPPPDDDTSAIVNAFRSFTDIFNSRKERNGGHEPPSPPEPPHSANDDAPEPNSIQRHSPPVENVPSPPPNIPAYGEVVQREPDNAESPADDTTNIDLDQLARDVFHELRDRLRIERERRHRR